MRSTDFPFAVTPRREGPDYTAPSADVADLLNPTDIIGRGRLEARETSWRDQLRDKLAVRVGRRNADKLIDLADFTPVGAAFVGNEAALAAREGRRGAAAANVALAALPLPGAGKALKKVAKAPLAVKPQGIVAYHGSPHRFDRFDMSKIGTGEGAQAYGHGLYFAEREAVAKAYRDALAEMRVGFKVNGKRITPGAGDLTPEEEAARFVIGMSGFDNPQSRGAGTTLSAPKAVREAFLSVPYNRFENDKDKIARILAEWRASKVAFDKASKGSMYQVRIDADPADFLDYDAPLSGQSEKVRGALDTFQLITQPREGLSLFPGTKLRIEQDPDLPEFSKYFMETENGTRTRLLPGDLKNMIAQNLDEVTGKNVVSTVANQFGGQDAATRALREAGIPGIKYLDQGSRGAGDGTRNYVVFDDKLVSILKRYGWAPGMAIPAAAMEEYEAEQEFARGGLAVTPDNYNEKVRLLREYGMLD